LTHSFKKAGRTPTFLLAKKTPDERYRAIMDNKGVHEAHVAYLCGSAAVELAFQTENDGKAVELFAHGVSRLREVAELEKISCQDVCLGVRAGITELYATRVYAPRRLYGRFPAPDALEAEPSLIDCLAQLGRKVVECRANVFIKERSIKSRNNEIISSQKDLVGLGNEIAVLLLLEDQASDIGSPDWRPANSMFSEENSSRKSRGREKKTWDLSVYTDNKTTPFYKIEVKSTEKSAHGKRYADDIIVVNVNEDLRYTTDKWSKLWLLTSQLGIDDKGAELINGAKFVRTRIEPARELLLEKFDRFDAMA